MSHEPASSWDQAAAGLVCVDAAAPPRVRQTNWAGKWFRHHITNAEKDTFCPVIEPVMLEEQEQGLRKHGYYRKTELNIWMGREHCFKGSWLQLSLTPRTSHLPCSLSTSFLSPSSVCPLFLLLHPQLTQISAKPQKAHQESVISNSHDANKKPRLILSDS